ncbi:hypothetical protein A3A50_00875 [Candidatus Woesebacteria bacterium RIFCSPLOWO2_01_FULL_38_20]|nr:MAG: hypothetical protein A3A50_00875 [Candidatus Woesebacteria bacterium RIFCSPLOWO2_01_FULL_38_20]
MSEVKKVKIGSRYQVVIPKAVRSVAKNITIGKEVVVEPVDEWTVQVKAKPSIEEWIRTTAGIAKGAWGKDSTRTLRKLRREWDRKF